MHMLLLRMQEMEKRRWPSPKSLETIRFLLLLRKDKQDTKCGWPEQVN